MEEKASFVGDSLLAVLNPSTPEVNPSEQRRGKMHSVQKQGTLL
jgi:hypothetical protein